MAESTATFDNGNATVSQEYTPTVETSSHQEATPQEKLLKQSEVNRIVGREVQEARRKERERLEAEYAQRNQSYTTPTQPTQSIGGIPQVSPDDIRKMIREETEQNLANMGRTHAFKTNLNQLVNKLNNGPKLYPDFDEKVGNLNLVELAQENPGIIEVLNSVDNPEMVLYHFADNEDKLLTLMNAMKTMPRSANSIIGKISNSLKANQNGKQVPKINEPLAPIKTSTAGMDNGELTAKDYRNRYKPQSK